MATASQAPAKIDVYRDLARQLRADSIRCSTAAGSGHPSSSLSAADLMAVLLAGHLRYDWSAPKTPANDHLIFSKGHASPLYYALLRAAGAIDDAELMTFRKIGSRLEGHPTPILPWTDVATGSLGQGLPIAVGEALAAKRPLNAPFHVWTLTGDSELAEGSIWEGPAHAGHEGLSNFPAIFAANRLGQRGPTELEWNVDAYAARARAFGCDAIVIDGHDLAAIDDAIGRARRAERPTVIVAKSIKGMCVSFIEDKEGWHGKALDPDQAKQALAELGAVASRTFATVKPDAWNPAPMPPAKKPEFKTYTDAVATRKAYGEAIAALGAARADVVVLDAEVSNSTHAEDFRIGGSRIVRGGGADDAVAVIAAGITVHEAVKAADQLKDTVRVRVIDAYSVKPIDADALVDAVQTTGGLLVVVEDHWAEGGLGDAVLAALAEARVAGEPVRLVHLAVREMPHSGKPAELLAAARIDAGAIAEAIKDLAG